MFSSWLSPLRPNDPWGDENQQLIVLLGPRIVPKEVAENRDLPDARDHVGLNWDLRTGLNRSSRIGQRGHLGRRDDLEQPLVLRSRDREVQAECVENIGEPRA